MKTAFQPTLFDTAEFCERESLPPEHSYLHKSGATDFTLLREGLKQACEFAGRGPLAGGSDRSPESIVRQLRAQIGCVTTASPETTETFSTGADCVDHLLPRGGLRVDGITEWTAEAAGCGAASLAMIAAATRLSATSGPLVVVGGEGTFYPPAAVSLGVPDDRILWVRPSRHADLVWAIDQSLRCETVAAVWAHIGPHLDDRDARRFQLAAETGNTPGLFIRPVSVRGRPSFTDVRFHVTGQLPLTDSFPATGRDSDSPQHSLPNHHAAPLGSDRTAAAGRRRSRLLRITLDRCRGSGVGQSVFVEVDERARVREIAPQCPQTQRPEIALASEIALTPTFIDSHCIDSANNHEAATVRLASELAHPASAKSVRPRRRA